MTKEQELLAAEANRVVAEAKAKRALRDEAKPKPEMKPAGEFLYVAATSVGKIATGVRIPSGGSIVHQPHTLDFIIDNGPAIKAFHAKLRAAGVIT